MLLSYKKYHKELLLFILMEEIIILKHNNNICGIYNSYELADVFIKSCIECGFIKLSDNIILESYKINSFVKTNIQKYSKKKSGLISSKYFKEPIDYEEFSQSNNSSSSESEKLTNKLLDNDSDDDIIPIARKIEHKNHSLSVDSDSELSLDADDFLIKRKHQREQTHKLLEINQMKVDIGSNINKLKIEKQKLEEAKTKFEYDLGLFEKFKNIKEKNNDFEIPELFKNKYNVFSLLEQQNDISFESFSENYNEEKILTSYEDLFECEQYEYKNVVPETFKSSNISDLMNVAF